MDLLRHGGMRRLFQDLRAPSTLGTFLRSFTFGHVRQLDAVAARLLPRLVRVCPLLPGADQVCDVDVDDTVRQVHGYAKQGVGYGYSGVKGLNALVATASTPLGAPVILATRLRKGSVNSARGAARLVTDALVTVRAAGAGGPHGASGSTGLVLLRADSAFFTRDVLAAAGRAGARFSVTARMNPSVVAAISQIEPTAWTAIRYPNAIYDEDERRWISDAEVAEIPFTAFTSRRKAQHLTGRLIVRRVKRLNPRSRSTTGAAGAEQGELFAAYRHHAVFTDSQLSMLTAERTHRAHAIIEQVIADLKNGPLAHLPSGKFTANAAWLVLAAIAFNLTRAAGCLERARPLDHRHPAHPAHRRPRPARPLRPTTRAATAPAMALAASLRTAHDQRHRTTRHSPPLTPPTGPIRNTQWNSRTDRRLPHAQHHKHDQKRASGRLKVTTVDPGSGGGPHVPGGTRLSDLVAVSLGVRALL